MTDHKKNDDQTAQEKNQAAQKDESKQRQQEQLNAAAKTLKSQGFNDEQIAQQLSSKFQMSLDEAKAAVSQNKEDDK
jgi:hypothetical protein